MCYCCDVIAAALLLLLLLLVVVVSKVHPIQATKVLEGEERYSCTGGWVGRRAGLDVCEKSHLHRDSIPGPSSP
jgi:hypothetical protein